MQSSDRAKVSEHFEDLCLILPDGHDKTHDVLRPEILLLGARGGSICCLFETLSEDGDIILFML